MKLLEMHTRTNSSNLKDIVNVEVPENQKKVINMKYDLKRMKTRLNNEKNNTKDIKKKMGLKERRMMYNKNRKPFSEDNAISHTGPKPSSDNDTNVVNRSLEDISECKPLHSKNRNN